MDGGCGQQESQADVVGVFPLPLVATVTQVTFYDEVPLGEVVQERSFRRHLVIIDVSDATNRPTTHHARVR